MAVEDQDVQRFRHILEAPQGCAISHEGAETDLLMANLVNSVTHILFVVSHDLFWFIV